MASAAEFNTKITEYMDAGVRLVWIVYPKTRTAHIDRPGQQPRIVKENEFLSGEDVLPGFEFRLGELFE